MGSIAAGAMRMNWRYAALSLVAAAAVGCGGGGAASGQGGDEAGTVEIVSFKGGYGIDYFEKAAKDFTAETGTPTAVSGDPKVWEQLRGAFAAKDVPDVTWPGWGFDYWGNVYDGQVMAVDEFLDQPAWGQTEGKFRDMFDEQLLRLGEYEGKQYLLPYHVNINGWWYNKKLFKENGWTAPKTFEELIVLNDKLKAKGIAPMTFQGQYPYYMLYAFIFPWIISSGGLEAWNACQNLEPGAWKSPHVIEAARRVATLRDRGDFMKEALGLNHTDSQTEFLKGNAAFVPCGTWFYAEMREIIEKDSNLLQAGDFEFMLPPTLAGGKGDPTSVMVAIEPWIIPQAAKNPQKGMDYFKYLASPEVAKGFVEEKGTLMALKGLEDANYPVFLQEPARLFAASKTKWNAEYRLWYPPVNQAAEDAMTALLNGSITPEQFAEQCEAAAEQARNDDRLVKRKVS